MEGVAMPRDVNTMIVGCLMCYNVIISAAVQQEWSFCPFVGGFDFRAFIGINKNKEVILTIYSSRFNVKKLEGTSINEIHYESIDTFDSLHQFHPQFYKVY